MARHGVIWIALGRRIAQIRSYTRASREVLLTSIRPGVVRACDRLTGGMFVAFGGAWPHSAQRLEFTMASKFLPLQWQYFS